MKAAGMARKKRKSGLQPVLSLRSVDVDVDRIRAGRAGEARERVRDQEDVRVDVGAVAHVGGEEAVQAARRLARGQRREPVQDRGEESRDAPQHEPDEVRQEEKEAEEDGQARAAQVVVERRAVTRRGFSGIDGRRLGRVGVRVAIGEEEEVAPGLRAVAESRRRRGRGSRAACVPRTRQANHAKKATGRANRLRRRRNASRPLFARVRMEHRDRRRNRSEEARDGEAPASRGGAGRASSSGSGARAGRSRRRPDSPACR